MIRDLCLISKASRTSKIALENILEEVGGRESDNLQFAIVEDNFRSIAACLC